MLFGQGFIREKIQMKFLILYIMAQMRDPISSDTMWGLAMCDDGFTYFDFAPCLPEMVETGHLTCKDGLYAITAVGLEANAACTSSLSVLVRRKVDKNIEEYNREIYRRSMIKTSVTPRGNGFFTLRLSFKDEKNDLMLLELTVPDEMRARRIAQDFYEEPQVLYSKLISLVWEGENEGK